MILGIGGRIKMAVVPYSTAKKLFRSGRDKVDQVILGTGDMEVVETVSLTDRLMVWLKERKSVHPRGCKRYLDGE